MGQKQPKSKDIKFIDDEIKKFWESIDIQQRFHQKLYEHNRSFEQSEPSRTADQFFSRKVKHLLKTEPKYEEIITYYRDNKRKFKAYVIHVVEKIKMESQITQKYQAELFESLPRSEQESVWSILSGDEGNGNTCTTELTIELYRKNKRCGRLIGSLASGDSGSQTHPPRRVLHPVCQRTITIKISMLETGCGRS